jgi:hypothetical protein
MNSSLMPSYLDPDILVEYISSTLYTEHFYNLYWTCRDLHKELYKSGEYIYKKICRHHQPHSIHDLPAITRKNGDHMWFKEGKLHRDGDLPAIIYASGIQCWYREGKTYCRDCELPAVTHANVNSPELYNEGKLTKMTCMMRIRLNS